MVVGACAKVCATHSTADISYSILLWRSKIQLICTYISTNYSTMIESRQFSASAVLFSGAFSVRWRVPLKFDRAVIHTHNLPRLIRPALRLHWSAGHGESHAN
jgi:hypothetical protein